MSREVTIDHDDLSSLSEDDLRYAVERSQLSQNELRELGYDTPEKVQALLRGDPSQHTNPFDIEVSGKHYTLTEDEIKNIVANREAAESAETPTIEPVGRNTVEVPDDEGGVEDYAEGWNNDDRRTELAKRGLSVDGSKAELIQRLLDDDASAVADNQS